MSPLVGARFPPAGTQGDKVAGEAGEESLMKRIEFVVVGSGVHHRCPLAHGHEGALETQAVEGDVVRLGGLPDPGVGGGASRSASVQGVEVVELAAGGWQSGPARWLGMERADRLYFQEL